MSACLGRVTQPPGLRVNQGGRQPAASLARNFAVVVALEWKEACWSRLQEADGQPKILPSVYYTYKSSDVMDTENCNICHQIEKVIYRHLLPECLCLVPLKT